MRMRQSRQDRMIEAVHKIKTGIHELYVNRNLKNHFLFPFQREELKALLAQDTKHIVIGIINPLF